jgi:Uma2 family endonuclease
MRWKRSSLQYNTRSTPLKEAIMATAASAVPVRDHTFYIDSDGQPVGETQRHVLNFRYTLEPLDNRYAHDPNVFVAGNMFVHYVQGDGNKHVSPDIFVVFGVPKVTVLERRSYRTWEEGGKGPDVVIELTSKSTRREDTLTKKALYQDVLKVKEYYLFDPYGEYLRPQLQGFRLAPRKYRPIRPVRDRLPSKLLQLHLEVEGDLLRFFDPATGRLLPIPPEIEMERQAEAEERHRAEVEIERLRTELDALKKRLPPS